MKQQRVLERYLSKGGMTRKEVELKKASSW